MNPIQNIVLLLIPFALVASSCKRGYTKVTDRYPNGNPAIVQIYSDRNDTATYLMKTFYRHGELDRTASVVKGKFTGNILEYWPDGTLRQVDSLLSPCDILVQNCNEILTRFHRNGTISQRFTESNGILVGEARQYDSNGILKIIYHLKDDSIKDGDYFQYFSNGEISVRATYQMGKMIGREYFFDRNGDTTKYYTINNDGQPSFPLTEWLDNGIVLRAEKVEKNSVRWSWFDKFGKLLKQKITFEGPSGFSVPDF